MGVSQTTVEQMVSRFVSTGHIYPADVYRQYGAESIEEFCTILFEEANAEGVRAEVLFCQAMKETGWLQFGGSIKPEQCNFGGLGATSGAVGGAWFENVRIGLRAQAQHLKLYASTDALVNPCVDPRWDAAVSAYGRGCAPFWKWAVPGIGYGESIYEMILQLFEY